MKNPKFLKIILASCIALQSCATFAVSDWFSLDGIKTKITSASKTIYKNSAQKLKECKKKLSEYANKAQAFYAKNKVETIVGGSVLGLLSLYAAYKLFPKTTLSTLLVAATAVCYYKFIRETEEERLARETKELEEKNRLEELERERIEKERKEKERKAKKELEEKKKLELEQKKRQAEQERLRKLEEEKNRNNRKPLLTAPVVKPFEKPKTPVVVPTQSGNVSSLRSSFNGSMIRMKTPQDVEKEKNRRLKEEENTTPFSALDEKYDENGNLINPNPEDLVYSYE